MKCPMLILGRPLIDTKEATDFGDCLEGQCAWWDDIYDQCALVTLAKRADTIDDTLAHINNKMPHELAPR